MTGTAASAANNLFKPVRSDLIICGIFRQLLSISGRSKSTMFNNPPSNKCETHFHVWIFIFMIPWLRLMKKYFVLYLLDFDIVNIVLFDIKYFFLKYADLKYGCIYQK